MASNTLFTYAEVATHNTRNDCWVIIHDKVFDLSAFLDEHPGGSGIILKYAGRDATTAFEPIHPPDITNTLPPTTFKGLLDNKSAPVEQTAANTQKSKPVVVLDKPPLSHLLNVYDFEVIARKTMKKEAWDYYSSGADDEITLRENHTAFQRLWLRPRVLVNVRNIDTRAKMLGYDTSLPLYITATALAKLAHPEGEVVLTRAAANQSIIQMLPTLGSCSLNEMTSARKPGQVQFFQLYVNSNRQLTEELVRRAETLGCKALFITVDAPCLGRREKDMRNKFQAEEPDVQKGTKVVRSQGTARAISQFIDAGLTWDDLIWFKSITRMPIVLKGVQCGEDAVLAAKHGVQGLVLSNHGGRQLDFARSGIEILPEVMAALKAAGFENSLEVYVDGGVRRGTDIFKALALGAKAVGIGRPSLYGLASYGQDGVEQVISLLRDEFEMCMRLMGCARLEDIKPEMVLSRNLGDHFTPTPKDFLAGNVYQMMTPSAKL